MSNPSSNHMSSSHIMITCPNSGSPVKTGFRAEPGSSLSALKQVNLGRCPRCGQKHAWSGADAFWPELPREPPRRGLSRFWALTRRLGAARAAGGGAG